MGPAGDDELAGKGSVREQAGRNGAILLGLVGSIELYRDRPPEEWPRAEDGSMSMISEPLDLQALLAEAD